MSIHDPVAVALFAFAVLCLFAGVIVICACVCGARDDRLMEAWRAERERSAAASDWDA